MMLGARQANMKFFKDCSYLLQFDRRSFTTDVIEHTNGVQVLSEDFKTLLFPTMVQYGYDFNYGTATDVGQLRNNGLLLNSTNLSNSSFNEHCDNEVCSISHLLNALNFGIDILSTIKNKQYVFPIEKTKDKSKGKYNTNYTDWEYEEYYDKTGNLLEVESTDVEAGCNEGAYKEANADELAWLKEDTCPDCCMSDTLSNVSEEEIYCNYCGINYFIPDELQKKKNYKHHSFSENWLN